jgi:hypothetical protein
MMPALHCATTSSGVDTMNIGEPMIGRRSRPSRVFGKAIALFSCCRRSGEDFD